MKFELTGNKVFIPPLEVQLSKKKKFILNLNNYRNLHYFQLNVAKKEFERLMKDELKDLRIEGKIRISFTLYVGTKRVCDTSNICCIVDKFFCDSLVKYGCIKDDNYNYIVGTDYLFGGYEKDLGRCEVRISPAVIDQNCIKEDSEKLLDLFKNK